MSLNRQEQNARIYHLPDDKAGVGKGIWFEAIDARYREMSFGQLSIFYSCNIN